MIRFQRQIFHFMIFAFHPNINALEFSHYFIISVTRRSRSDSRQSLTDLLTYSVSVSTDMTDVTLVSDDTY